jgi:hypothetical protein
LDGEVRMSRPLTATRNNRVVTSDEDATGHVNDYYGILQNIIEYTLGGIKELRVVFVQYDWFDPINNTRVNDFGMVAAKHELRYSRSNLLLAHQAQQVYYLSYPHPNLKNWWVVYKVNPEMHTHRYDEYIERNKNNDIYQEEIEGHQSFMLCDGASLTELATSDGKLLEEESCPSMKCLQKSKCLLERQERHE